MNPFWLGIIVGGVLGAFFGVLVMAPCVASKNADLYQEIEWRRWQESQMKHMEDLCDVH